MKRGTSPSEYLALSAHLARACWSRDSLPDLAQIYRTVHKITILYCRTSSSCIGIGSECLSKTASCIYIKLSYQHHRQEYKIEFVVHLLAFSWPWWQWYTYGFESSQFCWNGKIIHYGYYYLLPRFSLFYNWFFTPVAIRGRLPSYTKITAGWALKPTNLQNQKNYCYRFNPHFLPETRMENVQVKKGNKTRVDNKHELILIRGENVQAKETNKMRSPLI